MGNTNHLSLGDQLFNKAVRNKDSQQIKKLLEEKSAYFYDISEQQIFNELYSMDMTEAFEDTRKKCEIFILIISMADTSKLRSSTIDRLLKKHSTDLVKHSQIIEAMIAMQSDNKPSSKAVSEILETACRSITNNKALIKKLTDMSGDNKPNSEAMSQALIALNKHNTTETENIISIITAEDDNKPSKEAIEQTFLAALALNVNSDDRILKTLLKNNVLSDHAVRQAYNAAININRTKSACILLFHIIESFSEPNVLQHINTFFLALRTNPNFFYLTFLEEGAKMGETARKENKLAGNEIRDLLAWKFLKELYLENDGGPAATRTIFFKTTSFYQFFWPQPRKFSDALSKIRDRKNNGGASQKTALTFK